MNPTVMLAAGLVWAATVGGAFWYGTGVGKDHVKAETQKVTQAIIDTREAARQGAAEEIAKMKPVQTTITRKLETIVREKEVFKDCRSGQPAVDLFNGKLPKP